MPGSKRVLVLSDLHCGHNLGLTPPKYFNSFREIQEVGWNFYTKNIKKLGKIDLCIVNGDAIDGAGKKESIQHNTTDISTQQKIAMECLEYVKAKKYIFLRGTPFHTTDSSMESEDAIAKHFNAEIHDSRKIDVNGCILHCRHTTGKGSSPYASVTSLQSSSLAQLITDVETGNVKADIYIRSHIHESICVKRGVFTAITTPCFQFKGAPYGRRFTGQYSYGFVYIDIISKNEFDIKDVLLKETGGSYKKEEITKI